MTSEYTAVRVYFTVMCLRIVFARFCFGVFECMLSVCNLWWLVAVNVRFDVIPYSEEDYLYKLCHQSEATSLDL